MSNIPLQGFALFFIAEIYEFNFNDLHYLLFFSLEDGLIPLNIFLALPFLGVLFFTLKVFMSYLLIYLDFRSAFPRYRYESINETRMENSIAFKV